MAFKDRAKMIEYNNKWQKENFDRINLTVPKGQKDAIKEYAKGRGESVNGFIWRAITGQMERDREEST